MTTSNDIRRRLGALVTRFADEAHREGAAAHATTHGMSVSALTQYLGLLMADASPSDLATVRPHAVGFGSRVLVQDVNSGETRTLCLMSGHSMGHADDHVSMESPLGAALLGKRTGTVVDVRTPTGPRSIQVLAVHSLLDLLEVLDPQEGDLLAGAGR